MLTLSVFIATGSYQRFLQTVGFHYGATPIDCEAQEQDQDAVSVGISEAQPIQVAWPFLPCLLPSCHCSLDFRYLYASQKLSLTKHVVSLSFMLLVAI